MKEVIMQVASYSSDYPKAPIYVADLVRCKECLHSYEWDSGCGTELVCKARRCDPAEWGSSVEFYVEADDFCSYGEREGE